MKKVSDVYADVFSKNSQLTLQQVSDRLENYQAPNPNTSIMVQQSDMARLLSLSAESARISADIIQQFAFVHSLMELREGLDSTADIENKFGIDDNLKKFQQAIYDIIGTKPVLGLIPEPAPSGVWEHGAFNLGHVLDRPINLVITSNKAIYNRPQAGVLLSLSTRSLEELQNDPSYNSPTDQFVFASVLSGHVDSTYAPAVWNTATTFKDSFEVSGYVIDSEALFDEVQATVNSSEMLVNVLKRAQVDGNISVAQIHDIVNATGQSAASAALEDMIAGMGALDFTSVITLTGRVLQLGAYEVDPTTQTYTPLDTPTYVSSIGALLFSGIGMLLSVIATCINIIWGAVVSIVVSLVSELIDMINQAKEATQSRVIRHSYLPVFNMPLGLVENYTPPVPEALATIMSEYGCAATVDYDTGSANVRWFLPTYASDGSIARVSVQSFLSAMPVVQMAYRPVRYEIDRTGWFRVYSVGSTLVGNPVFSTDTYELLTLSDEQLLDVARKNVCLTAAKLITYFGELDVPISITFPSNFQTIVKSDEWKSLPTNSAMAVIYGLMSAHYLDPDLGLVGFDWDGLYALIQSDHWRTAMTNWMATTYVGNSDSIVCGVELANPSVAWPSINRDTIIASAAIFAAIGVAGIVASTLIAKKMKVGSVAKLSSRQALYNQALSDYEANPSKQNLRRLYKANNKLTRAWNRAGRSGVSMYNGFATSTSNITGPASPAIGDSTINDTLFNGVMQSMAEGDLSTENIIDNVARASSQTSTEIGLSLIDIKRLITGDVE